ncbi:hypothetical protein BC938DRAFT_473413 [Jimgerdemannia flammicorona]|uniref:Replication protein A OB domain-containing protein n=1 Tax=Jimgerdemannia flammicorona TaxID=994334 RepID=A0A433Q448_9FUNG|nr:hypothetical protein BC938DRAFT_473413 [Jimgerdemannia flammicorona]
MALYEYEHLKNPGTMINNPVYFRGDRSEPIQLNGLLSTGFVTDFLGGAELRPDIILRVEKIEHVALNGTSRYTDIPVNANTVCKVTDGSYTMLGSCHYITGARLVCKSGQWQLSMGDEAQIVTSDILQIAYSFIPIQDIREGRPVDILGIVVDVGKVSDVIVSGYMTVLCKIKIVDVSCHAILVTFWGQQAINLAVTDGAILAISNADPRIYHARYELYILDNSWVEQGLRTPESDALQQ